MGVLYDIFKAYARLKDEFLLKQFERYGYSVEKVYDMLWKGRISIIKYNDTEDYCIDGIALFRVREHRNSNGNVVSFESYDILPPKVGR